MQQYWKMPFGWANLVTSEKESDGSQVPTLIEKMNDDFESLAADRGMTRNLFMMWLESESMPFIQERMQYFQGMKNGQ